MPNEVRKIKFQKKFEGTENQIIQYQGQSKGWVAVDSNALSITPQIIVHNSDENTVINTDTPDCLCEMEIGEDNFSTEGIVTVKEPVWYSYNGIFYSNEIRVVFKLKTFGRYRVVLPDSHWSIVNLGSFPVGQANDGWYQRSGWTTCYEIDSLSGKTVYGAGVRGSCSNYRFLKNATTSSLNDDLKNMEFGFGSTFGGATLAIFRNTSYINDVNGFRESVDGKYLVYPKDVKEDPPITMVEFNETSQSQDTPLIYRVIV